MKIETLPLGLLQTNCFVVHHEGGAYIVDPGGDVAHLESLLKRYRLKPGAVLLTHAHVDHIGAVPKVARDYDLPVVMHPREEKLYRSPANALLPFVPAVKEDLPETVPELESFLPGMSFEILETPGHTPGGISFYFPQAKLVFSGDALFAGSVGRVDLPDGDGDLLMKSIHDVLFALPDETTVYPGHGPTTTIGHEKAHNPYV